MRQVLFLAMISVSMKRSAFLWQTLLRFYLRLIDQELKSLEKLLLEMRSMARPKTKFAFKRQATTALDQPTPNPSVGKICNVPVPPQPPTNLSLSSCSYRYLSLESLPESTSREDLVIYDLDHCIVNLIPPPGSVKPSRLHFSALHIRHLTKTLLLLPPIDGSVLIHNLSDCVIVVDCHQVWSYRSSRSPC